MPKQTKTRQQLQFFREALKNEGFTEYDLRVFRDITKQYEKVSKRVIDTNETTIGSRTGTKQFDYEQLYNEYMYRNDIGTPKELIRALKDTQQDEILLMEKYNITSEIRDIILNTYDHISANFNMMYSRSEIVEHIADEIASGRYTIEEVIQRSEKYNDIFLVYASEDALTGEVSIPKPIFNRYPELYVTADMYGAT